MRIAVTGAAGRLGGQVAGILAATGEHEVVAVSRRPLTGAGAGQRCEVAVADYADPPSLRAALHGVDTLVFVSSDGEGWHVLRHHENVIGAAADSGVGHIVALSGLDADPASPFCYAMTYAYTERMLHDSGCGVSIARASIYTEFFLSLLRPARASGEIRLPAADGRISLVSRADVGRCLAALAAGDPAGGDHDITGPEALDLAAVAALARRAWGAPVRYTDLAPADYLAEVARTGLEPGWCYAFSTMFASVREQRWAGVSGEVRRLTGRPPVPLLDLVSEG